MWNNGFMIPRFHCPPDHATLAPGAHVDLPEAIARHAVKVLRMRSGDTLTLFDGRGGEWPATLTKVGAGGTALASIGVHIARECESSLAVTLMQGLPAGDKMDWVVEKCVELGVTAIQPVAAHRSVIRLSDERMARRVTHWNQIAAAACAQSGRNTVPVVAPILDLPQALVAAKAHNGARLLLDPGAATPLRDLPAATQVCVLVGPEGGWEDSERRAAQVAGFASMALGPRVLRTETAGAAVLAALQAVWGDF